MNGAPLQGMRVIEASAFVAAPSGGMALAQLGADVIRIDPPGGGLDYRRWPVTADNTSLFWAGLNKSKRSVAIDIQTDEGRELAMALACSPGEDAGILLTNLPPRGWLSYEALVRRRPDLIQLVVQGTRSGGSAVDYTVNPSIGLPNLTGPRDSADPVNHVLPAWDLVTGQMAAVGLLAAERVRLRTGRGQQVTLALEDVALAVMAHLGFIAESRLGQSRRRHGNDLFGAFGRDFKCADGQRVMVVGLTGKQWKALCEATGTSSAMAELAVKSGLDLKLEGNRFLARDEIAAILAPWFLARSAAAVAKALDATGACWSRYQTVDELARSSALDPAHNSMFSHLVQPGVGEVISPASPLNFLYSSRRSAEAAPALGQHTEEVLTTILGLSTAEFGKLHDRKIVATAKVAS
jgi:2-methylfumaryl-CoA isomerase